jgi:hypothetical protein
LGVTAPFRGADEYNHFFRANHVSIGRMIAHHAAFGVVGEQLRASLLALACAKTVIVAKGCSLGHTQLERRKGG